MTGPDEHRVHPRGAHGLGQGEAGGDGEGPDAPVRELHVAHVGDAVEGRLGGRVGHAPPAGPGGSRRRGEGGLGEHVDQAALATLEHGGQEQLGEQQRMEVVAHQAAFGQLEGQVQNPVHGARTLVDGVVDQNVDPAHVGQGDGGHPLDRRPVHQVHGHGQAVPSQGLDLGRRGLEAAGDGQRLVAHQGARGVGAAVALVHGAGRDHDVEAAPGQRDGGTAADAPAGPGDEGDAPGLRHPPPTSSRRSGARRRRGPPVRSRRTQRRCRGTRRRGRCRRVCRDAVSG